MEINNESIKQLKISYNIQVFPILSNSVTKSTDINLDDLKIQYKDKELLNPCLLALEIVNIGNEAINEPPIKIRADEDIEIIPGYFEDIPEHCPVLLPGISGCISFQHPLAFVYEKPFQQIVDILKW